MYNACHVLHDIVHDNVIVVLVSISIIIYLYNVTMTLSCDIVHDNAIVVLVSISIIIYIIDNDSCACVHDIVCTRTTGSNTLTLFVLPTVRHVPVHVILIHAAYQLTSTSTSTCIRDYGYLGSRLTVGRFIPNRLPYRIQWRCHDNAINCHDIVRTLNY